SRPIPPDEATRLLHEAVLIRSDLEREPLDAAAHRIAALLSHPTSATDRKLRLHLLCVQGDLEFQRDLDAAEASWNEALEIAAAIGAGDWESRAKGELGTIAFLKGELRESLTLVGQAFLAAGASGDVAAQIRYQTALGEGFAEFGRPNDAIRLFNKALVLARNTPGAYFPFTAHVGKARLLALDGDGKEGHRLLETSMCRSSLPRAQVVIFSNCRPKKSSQANGMACNSGPARLAFKSCRLPVDGLKN
ncbi:MAG: hypothetical protein R2762_30365, partial [Bryobacteraceae bacterium]